MSTLYNNKYDILASTIQPNPASVKYWADLSSLNLRLTTLEGDYEALEARVAALETPAA